MAHSPGQPEDTPTTVHLDPGRPIPVAGTWWRQDVLLERCDAHRAERQPTTGWPALYLLDGTLEPEPSNEADPNAIAVLLDGRHIGYVPAALCEDIHGALAPHAPWIAAVELALHVPENGVVTATFDRCGTA